MKKVLSLFLSLLMLLSVSTGIDFSAYAQTDTEGLQHIFTITNPVYDGIIDRDTLLAGVEDSSFSLTLPKLRGSALSVDEAAQTMRDAMVARSSTVSISVVSPYIFMADVATEILNKAISQDFSVSSVDGDYLKFNLASAQAYGKSVVHTSKGYEYLIQFEIGYLTTASQEKRITEKVNQTLTQLDLDGKSQYKKIKLIHDFVCETVRYDYNHFEDDTYTRQFSTYGALIDGYAVCQGYATLFYRLCMEAGVPSRVIAGGNHGWNIAKLGNIFYYVDTTWDDTTLDFYPEKDSVKGYWADEYVYDWFLKGSDYYSEKKHPEPMSDYVKPSFQKNYPISTTSYVCTHPSTYWSIPENADCTLGFEKVSKCTECDEPFDTATVPAGSEHKYVKKVVAPTCTKSGYTEYTCSVCNSQYRENVISALGHTYKNYVTKATTSANGSIVNKCSVCGAVKSSTTIAYPKTITLSTTSYTYDGKSHTPTVTVKDSTGKTLVRNTDYVLKYASGRTNAGTYYVDVVFQGNYSGTKRLTFKINPISATKCTATLNTTATYYNGSVKTPTVTVKCGSTTLKKGTDYTVSYASGRKLVGRYAVKVTYKGNYSGTKTLYFNIIPRGTTVSKVTAKSKGFTVSWATQKTQTTGYQIQYSTSSNFSNAKTITMSKNTYSAKSITKLSGNKKYYVRVRTYRVTKFGGKNYNIYSPWSSAKSVTTKK